MPAAFRYFLIVVLHSFCGMGATAPGGRDSKALTSISYIPLASRCRGIPGFCWLSRANRLQNKVRRSSL